MSQTRSIGGLRAALFAAAIMVAVPIAETLAYGAEPLQQAMQHPLWQPATAAVLAALGLAMWALPALAEAQGPALGRWGRRASGVAVFGLFLNSGLIYTHTFFTPVLANDFEAAWAIFYSEGAPPVGLLIAFALGRLGMNIGFIVFGVATIRAGVMPAVGGVLVVVGGALGLLALPADLPIGVAGVINLVPFLGLAVMSATALRESRGLGALGIPNTTPSAAA